jgi:DNA-directed RNA polymerase subunit RPC12/RpoP
MEEEFTSLHKITIPIDTPDYYGEIKKGMYTENNYNFKCPHCGGEFNFPSKKDGVYVCPFCGKKMEGFE